MENLKVKVSSEAESKEAQGYFEELGAVCCSGLERNKNVNFLFMESGFLTARKLQENFDKSKCKEITLPELRDLVVLKHNDVGYATHENNYVQKLYKGWKGWYICALGAWLWNEDSIGYLPIELKPIEEKEMKEPKQAEFLVKTDSGYVLQVLDENSGGADVVRVPDGAEIAILAFGVVYFWKSHFFNSGVHKDWVDMKEGWDASWYLKSVPSAIISWQRETRNDQVASAEEYREMISNAASIGLTSVVTDIAQSCSGGAIRNASSQGQSEFPLNNYELNHRVAKAFNAVRGTDLNEDDVNYIRELINLTISHYGERK